jgi:uncharacterized protein (DUF58 family)
MRAALSGLTTRGRSFLAAGLAACLCGLVLGETDLLRVGVFLCVLPFATAVLVARTRYRLSCVRRIEPQRVPVGEPAQVVLRLENLSRVPSGVLLLEDRLPYSLGGRPRYVVNHIESRGVREVAYVVRSDVRGRYPIGPLSLRFADLFGLIELTRSFTTAGALMVTPRVVPLGAMQLAGNRSGGGDSHARSIATSGEDDVTPREYRHGDDLRRVHWRSTARHGELMVRREEQPWQNSGVLFLDSRARAHRGDGPGSSLEWAITAAASIGSRLSRDGFGLRLVTDTGQEVSGYGPHSMTGAPFEGLLLDNLALFTASGALGLTDAVATIARGGSEGLLIALLGELTDSDLQALSRFRRDASTGIAILLDTATWGSVAGNPNAREHAVSLDVLRMSGWRVVSAGAQTQLPTLWQDIAATGRSGRADAARLVGRR